MTTAEQNAQQEIAEYPTVDMRNTEANFQMFGAGDADEGFISIMGYDTSKPGPLIVGVVRMSFQQWREFVEAGEAIVAAHERQMEYAALQD